MSLGGRTAAGMLEAFRSDVRRASPAEQARVEQLAAQLRDDLAAFGATHPADAAMGVAVGLFHLHAVLRDLGGTTRRLDGAFGRMWAAASIVIEAEGADR